MFAERNQLDLIEVNFEERPEFSILFDTNDTERIILQLEIEHSRKITAGRSCIFLDEIQNHPRVLVTLRYFFEKQPELLVIAAGSLLEFLLEDHAFSMPVGRIEYLFLGPMTYEEFLIAGGETQLVDYLNTMDPSHPIPPGIHQAAMRATQIWMLTGGMPEVVATWIEERSLLEVDRVKHTIINTLRDDFSKYKRSANTERLQRAFERFPGFVGKKIVYSQINEGAKARDTEKSLHLLEQARIIYRVNHSDGNGVPLGAERNEKRSKGLFLDVGLLSAVEGLSLRDIEDPYHIMMINSGALAEQFIGQHLLYMNDFYRLPELYYWSRQKSHSSAEIDYLVTHGRHVIPVEVKAGKTGTLRSLHVFMEEKRATKAIRFYTGPCAVADVKSSLPGSSLQYRLLSLPLFLVEQWKRILSQISG